LHVFAASYRYRHWAHETCLHQSHIRCSSFQDPTAIYQ
jgi:hypothetical protein